MPCAQLPSPPAGAPQMSCQSNHVSYETHTESGSSASVLDDSSHNLSYHLQQCYTSPVVTAPFLGMGTMIAFAPLLRLLSLARLSQPHPSVSFALSQLHQIGSVHSEMPPSPILLATTLVDILPLCPRYKFLMHSQTSFPPKLSLCFLCLLPEPLLLIACLVPD